MNDDTAMHERAAAINKNAEDEGWRLAENGDANEDPYRLERDDDANVFTFDETVWEHLIVRASNRDSNTVAAFNFIRRFCPKEWDAIRGHLKNCNREGVVRSLNTYLLTQPI